MKKIAVLVFVILICLGTMPVYAADDALISDMEVSLKSAETPNRLEVIFDLAEPIDLSNGDSNIIYEFFTSENLETVQYRKDKTWSGYLNSYDAYPSGERKYSSGGANDSYPDNVPSARIYTSVKTSGSIDVASVAAIRVTVLRSDGSGERVTVGIDGAVVDSETIVALETEQDNSAGIIIDSADTQLPVNTVVVADEVTGGPVYEAIGSLLPDVSDFIAIDISLEANGSSVQPNGKVKISIPVPERFNIARLAVYRIEGNSKIPYPVTTETSAGITYATFESDHFSVYVLAETAESPTEPPPGITIQNEGTSYSRSGNETPPIILNKADIGEINEDEALSNNINPETGRANYGMLAAIGALLAALAGYLRRS